jgi:hypothetical protein
MCPRGLIVVLLVQLALDLAIPLTPGPGGFDVEDAIEALPAENDGPGGLTDRAPPARVPVVTDAAVAAPVRRSPGFVGRRARSWQTRIGRTPPPVSDPAAAEDH